MNAQETKNIRFPEAGADAVFPVLRCSDVVRAAILPHAGPSRINVEELLQTSRYHYRAMLRFSVPPADMNDTSHVPAFQSTEALSHALYCAVAHAAAAGDLPGCDEQWYSRECRGLRMAEINVRFHEQLIFGQRYHLDIAFNETRPLRRVGDSVFIEFSVDGALTGTVMAAISGTALTRSRNHVESKTF